jgi:hypothetical protein
MITSVNINSDEMELYLKKFRRRIKWRDGWILAQRTLFLPSLTAMILQSVGRFIPVERLGLWTLLPFAIWLLVVILYGTLKPL